MTASSPTTSRTFDDNILAGWLHGGLCMGEGDGVARVCLEQAIALACDYGLVDEPEKAPFSCIDACLATYGRHVNDNDWNSEGARANGLRELAFEHVASKGIDQQFFVKKMLDGYLRELLPDFIEARWKNGWVMATKDEAARLLADLRNAPNLAPDSSVVEQAVDLDTGCKTSSLMRWGYSVDIHISERDYIGASAALADMLDEATGVGHEEDDTFLVLGVNICLRALREAKKKAGLPLYAELVAQGRPIKI